MYARFIIAAALISAPAAQAQPNRADRPDRADRLQQMLDRLDTNNDGIIDRAERAAARETMGNRPEGRRGFQGGPPPGTRRAGGFGPGPDGPPFDGADRGDFRERREARRAEILERFDADNDGTLSEAEREAARAARPNDGPRQGMRHAPRGHHRRGPEGHRGPNRAQILEDFDADNDGTLNEAEREAARAAFQERRQARRAEMIERFDTDGDGTLNETEREAARAEFRERRAAHRAEMLEQFDADGNGRLEGEERRNAHEAFRARRNEARMDTDRNGIIDLDETTDALGRDLNRDGRIDGKDRLKAANRFLRSNGGE